MAIKHIVESFLPNETVEEFAKWAFGPDFKDMTSLDLLRSWNVLHGEKYLLQSDSNRALDIAKMITIWEGSL
jgi:hypothetical protein